MVQHLPRKLRIIGGKWRGRKIAFPSLPELRPTADRIRETLFNWLSPYIKDAYCLDLFAGSGALGFEALSRGCAHVTFLDRSKNVIETLQKNAEILNTTNTEFVCEEFTSEIPKLKNVPFNIVFLDPPFYQRLINQAVLWLEKTKILAPQAYIYVEAEKNISFILPSNWEIYREKRTTSIFYSLFFRFKKGD
ncbi:16S rRNA (guanine(966)-N(2))-methyltransferase RsmD [Candidatus Coxiella mudrowiae]|uniref:16S rRNA (guanine(966)-N(2))-methyltransferase RsmD n=1 Tax=Candidatus Coxiella mudrowiae TaxID=2054173 RepID=UPI000C2930B2|nr:16S rRNA (guanine(966)-N(2))-methyltransferase RsmD [Candidatus Coxiella mudrowiae]